MYDTFDDLKTCLICGNLSNDSICDRCIEEEATLENCIEYAKTIPNELKEFVLDDSLHFGNWLIGQIKKGKL